MKSVCFPSALDRRCVPRVAVQLATTFLLSATFVGCQDQDWHAETYSTSGKITINGEPAAGAVVTLHPMGDNVDARGSCPWGIVREDATFSLSTYERDDGAPLGPYTVTVRWPLDVTDMAAAMTDRLGGAYSSQARSPWKVTIDKGENELPPIHIAGAQVQDRQTVQLFRNAPPMPAPRAN